MENYIVIKILKTMTKQCFNILLDVHLTNLMIMSIKKMSCPFAEKLYVVYWPVPRSALLNMLNFDYSFVFFLFFYVCICSCALKILWNDFSQHKSNCLGCFALRSSYNSHVISTVLSWTDQAVRRMCWMLNLFYTL